jgi:type VI secretion system protein ImpA
MIDLALLTNPVPGDDPCGPDLDAEGDADYLNFFASVDAVFPASFFEVRDGEGNIRRFDPSLHDIASKLATAENFAGRTRDLRLIVLIAKLSILNRDIRSFNVCIEAIAELFERQWEGVHPRGEGDDYSYRQMAVEALNVMPTVVIPLQFLPLAESRRFGAVTFRTWLLAKGEIAPRADDLVLDASAIDQVFDQVDLDRLKSVTATYTGLATFLERICKTWSEKAGASGLINIDRVQQAVGGVASLLEGVVKRRDPAAATAVPDAAAANGEDADRSAQIGVGFRVTSVGSAAAALGGIAAYFGRMEPSSPALLLVRQAEHLLGKSFAEAIHILVPNHAETAAINIGRGWVFDVSVDQMAKLASPSEAAAPAPPEEPQAATSVSTRAQALALLEQVSAFFRNVEPSSPVPFLADRARELSQRDFLSLLVDVLPSGSLRNPENQT